MIQNLKLAAYLSLFFFSVTASAESEISANIGVTSNYLWRGVSQSFDKPALSGEVSIANDNGLYTGLWAGTIDWGDGSGIENDLFFGYTTGTDNTSYDLGYVYYSFPSSGFEDSNFGELYIDITLYDLGFGLSHISNSNLADDEPFGKNDVYFYASYTLALPNDFSMSLSAGHFDFDSDELVYGDADYSHYQLGLEKGDFILIASEADDEGAGDAGIKIALGWSRSFYF